MTNDNRSDRTPIPDDDGNSLFELWKEGEFLRGYHNFEDAKAACDKGLWQKQNFEVRSKGKVIWPTQS